MNVVVWAHIVRQNHHNITSPPFPGEGGHGGMGKYETCIWETISTSFACTHSAMLCETYPRLRL